MNAAKAWYGAIAATLGAFLAGLLPYISPDAQITDVGGIPLIGWVTALIAALGIGGVTGGVVYRTTNRPTNG